MNEGQPRPRHHFLRRSQAVGRSRNMLLVLVAVGGLALTPAASRAQSSANQPVQLVETGEVPPSNWLSPEQFPATLKLMVLLSVASLVPAIVLMTTCFVRITVVLYLLRQALGAQQLPPNQVLTALAVFITGMIMAPVWKQVHYEAIRPYAEQQIDAQEAWQRGTAPVKRFMSAQIERAGNSDDVWLFLEYLPEQPEPSTYEDVPIEALAPAFLLSELKTAFVIGFQVYLPFLIIDLVVAAVLTSMGMFMVPPSLIAIPFKLLLFVLVDGWHLVVSALLQSVAGFS